MRVAVAGATGFVGSLLVPALVARGHDVRALTRSPQAYRGAGTATYTDLDDLASLATALAGADAAYLLVHALPSERFGIREAEQARAFADAADSAGLGQLVCLGGLGRDDAALSPHLGSRRKVERILRRSRVPVTVLRSGIVIGPGSAGWEMLRQLSAVLPVMVTDRRGRTLHQPIAAADAVGYLADVLGNADCVGRTFEIGGSDVLSYADMAHRLARLTGRFPPLQVPWIPTLVSAIGVHLLTDVDGATAHALLGSMGTDAVVTDDLSARLLPRAVMGFDEAATRALAAATGP